MKIGNIQAILNSLCLPVKNSVKRKVISRVRGVSDLSLIKFMSHVKTIQSKLRVSILSQGSKKWNIGSTCRSQSQISNTFKILYQYWRMMMSQTQLPATSSIGLNIKIGKKIPIMHIISNLGLALKILENKRAIMKCVSG